MNGFHLWLSSCIVTVFLSGCQSNPSPRSQAILNGSPGEQLNQICFTRNIDDWHELDSQSIVLRTNRDEYYRVELVGGCDARNSFMQIETRSRTGICLGQGDEIRFDRGPGLACRISRINRWHLADIQTE